MYTFLCLPVCILSIHYFSALWLASLYPLIVTVSDIWLNPQSTAPCCLAGCGKMTEYTHSHFLWVCACVRLHKCVVVCMSACVCVCRILHCPMCSERIRILVAHTFVPSHSLSLPGARQRANITFSGPDTPQHANALACGLIETLTHPLQAYAQTEQSVN
jgi:hypothetical protein